MSKATLELPAELFNPHLTAASVWSSEHWPSSRVQVWLKQNEQHYLLCQLDRKHNVQVDLNLNLSFGEQVTYYLKGSGVVHLTGYMLEPDTGMTDEEEDEEEEERDHSDTASIDEEDLDAYFAHEAAGINGNGNASSQASTVIVRGDNTTP